MDEKLEKMIIKNVLEEIKSLVRTTQRNAYEKKTFYTGYHECAKDIVEAITTKLFQLEDEIYEEVEEPEENITNESPLIVDS